MPNERALVASEPRLFSSDIPNNPVREVASPSAIIPRQSSALHTGAQFDFAPDLDWQASSSAQAPKWILPAAIGGAALGLGTGAYLNSQQQQDEEERNRQAAMYMR